MEQQKIESPETGIVKADEVLPIRRQVLDIRPEEVDRQFKAIHQFQATVRRSLIDGHDFGVIPGTEKPTLFKPGAEKIAKLLNCFDDYEEMGSVENWDKPFFHYKYKCVLYEMSSSTKVSSGIGECNSYEAKYRYRWIPEWTLSEEQKQMRDTAHFKLVPYKDKSRGEFKLYRFENEDIFSQVNTILKMAKKRALVDAALSAGRLSDLFTQDLEDMNGDEPVKKPQKTTPVERPTYDQGMEINRLISTLVDKFGSDPGEIMDALTQKFAVADLAELTADQSVKIIAYLQKAIKGKEKNG